MSNIFNGTAEQIENNSYRVKQIDKPYTSEDGEKYYPNVNAVIEYVNGITQEVETGVETVVKDAEAATNLVNNLVADFTQLKTDVEKLQALKNIIEQNNGVYLSFWVGTQKEYDALESKPNNCLVIITDDISNHIIETGFLSTTTSSVSKAYYEKYSNGIIKVYASVRCTRLLDLKGASGVLLLDDFGIIHNSLINCDVSVNVDAVNETSNYRITGEYVYRPTTQPQYITTIVMSLDGNSLEQETYTADLTVVAKWKEV